MNGTDSLVNLPGLSRFNFCSFTDINKLTFQVILIGIFFCFCCYALQVHWRSISLLNSSWGKAIITILCLCPFDTIYWSFSFPRFCLFVDFVLLRIYWICDLICILYSLADQYAQISRYMQSHWNSAFAFSFRAKKLIPVAQVQLHFHLNLTSDFCELQLLAGPNDWYSGWSEHKLQR